MLRYPQHVLRLGFEMEEFLQILEVFNCCEDGAAVEANTYP
jgi:hypothetical protein